MQLDRAAYKAKYGFDSFVFVDNITAEISEADMRTYSDDQADSLMFLSDNFIDEDSMATNSATKAPSQQSVKAYVDAVIDPGFKSTGVTAGNGVSINADPTKFDIFVIGQIVNPVTFVTTPISVNQTAIPVSNLAQKVTYVGIDASSTVIQQAEPFTTEQLYSLLGEFVLVHTNGTSLNAVNNFPNSRYSVIEQLHAHMRNFGMTNLRGNVITPNGANLQIDKSSGVLERVGVGNFDADNPNEKTVAALTAMTFRYRNQDSDEDADTQNLDVTNYDLAGTTTVMANNKFKVDRVALFSSNLVRLQRGQHEYDTLAQAINGIVSDNYVLEDNIKDNGVIIAFLVLKKSITNLTTAIAAGDAKIVAANKFGGSTSGGSTSPDATETVKGILELATQAETNAGTDDLTAITPLKLAKRQHQTISFDTTLVSDIITIDATSLTFATFTENTPITEPKTWVFTNILTGSMYFAKFSITGLHAQTLPALTKMADNFNAMWDSGTRVWTPFTTGEYIMRIINIAGGYSVTIQGPFT